MDHLCVRCARQALRGSQLTRRDANSALVRHLSMSSLRLAGHIDPSSNTAGNSSPKQQQRTKPSPASSTPKVLTRKTPNSGSGFRITRTPVDSPKSQPRSPQQGSGVLLRRSGPPPETGYRPPNSGPPRRGGGSPTGRPAGRPTGAGGQRGPRRGPSSGGKRGPREGPDTVFDEYVDEDDIAFAEHEAAQENAGLNNGLPTVALPYSPAEQSVQELRKDWPDTPLSASGLSESVVQRLRFLARDLPHGYWTPRQIAERVIEGGLVRFEDAEHKAKVMGWVERVLKEKREEGAKEKGWLARSLMKKSEEGPAEFTAIGEKDGEKKELVNGMVRGVYPELDRGQRPLLAGIQRQLRNNESYGAVDTGKFMGRIATLIGSVQKQAAQQQEAAAKQ